MEQESAYKKTLLKLIFPNSNRLVVCLAKIDLILGEDDEDMKKPENHQHRGLTRTVVTMVLTVLFQGKGLEMMPGLAV